MIPHKNIVSYFSDAMKKTVSNLLTENGKNVSEIRMTNGKALIVKIHSKYYYVSENGLTLECNDAYFVSPNDIKISFELITNSSVYAYNRYINEGYVTLPGGNRVGIVGKCCVDNGKIISVGDINSLNFRLACQHHGYIDTVYDELINGFAPYNILVVSPPGCGKTTFLREFAYKLGYFNKKIIICAVIDERYEFACSYRGQSMLNIGESNFVISGCEKSIAVPMVVRTMSPDVIITDELSGCRDVEAAVYAKKSGCRIIASAHGDCVENSLLDVDFIKNIFDKIVVLCSDNGPGTIKNIIGCEDL